MKKMKQTMKQIISLLLVAFLLAGCTKVTTEGNGTADTSGTSDTADTGNGNTAENAGSSSANFYFTAEPAQLNSTLVYDVPSQDVLRACEEGLIRLNEENEIVEGLAASWDVSEDGKEYTFHLRDANWSDGTPVTAADFVFAWKLVLKPENASTEAESLYVITGAKEYNQGEGTEADVKVEAVDEKTLKVELANPTPYFLSTLADPTYYPVNQEFYEKQESGGTNLYGTDADRLLYCGPWKIDDWVHESKVVLVKNEEYYNPEQAKIAQINLLIVADPNTAYNMFSNGELDMVELGTADLINLAQSDNQDLLTFCGGSTTFMAFNVQNEIFKNVNIRKAFSYAIDRQAFCDNVLKNGSVPATTFVSSVVDGLEGKTFQEMVQAEFTDDTSVAGAKAYLEKGLQELGLTELPQVTFLIDDRESIKTQATVYQEYWKQNLGVDMEVISQPYKTKLETQYAGRYMITISGWECSFNDPISILPIFQTDNGNNSMLYSNGEFDNLLEQASVETDPDKRLQMLKDAELVLMNDCAVAPLYYYYCTYILQPRVKGLVRNSFNDLDFYNAYIE